MTKAEIRKTYLSKRTALSEGEFSRLNEQICDVFFSTIDLRKVSILHTFVPIEKTREPDTWCIIRRVMKEFPHIQIAVPRINNQTGMMDNFFFENESQLEKNTWGIPEPKRGIAVPVGKIDVVLVPLLAVAHDGHRVGYGRGFYDKFLATLEPGARKIGLSFFSLIDVIDNVSPTDEKLTDVVTPQGIFSFN
jgi:5-formyltetrahydrofolate cyclo-ligase